MKSIFKFILAFIILLSNCIVTGFFWDRIYDYGIVFPLKSYIELPDIKLQVFSHIFLVIVIFRHAFNVKNRENVQDVYDSKPYLNLISNWFEYAFYTISLIVLNYLFF